MAAASPRGESDLVGLVVDGALQAVEPAETEGGINGCTDVDAREFGGLLVVSDPHYVDRVVVGLEPGAQVLGGGKEVRSGVFHGDLRRAIRF